MFRISSIAFTFILSIWLTDLVQAQNSISNLDDEGLALQGYDPVSYFVNDEPKIGKDEFTHDHNGAVYKFTNQTNKNTFIKNPENYEPKYGGWCAYAIGLDGSKVKIDPETFKIIDNELYLFYNFFPVNTLKKWNAREKELKEKADIQWTQIIE